VQRLPPERPWAQVYQDDPATAELIGGGVIILHHEDLHREAASLLDEPFKEPVGSKSGPVDSTRKVKRLGRLGNSTFAAVSLLSGIALGNYVASINGWLVLVFSVLLVGSLNILPLAWFVRSKKKHGSVRIGKFSSSIIKIANWFVQGVLAGEIYDLAYEAFVLEPRVTTTLAFSLGIVTIIGCFVLLILTMFLLKTVEEDFLVPFSATVTPPP
jgi:hypothetical protein